jgi:membrane-bound ClpP family serine protease
MNGITSAKIALFVVGIILIGYGMRTDSPTLRWTGIAFLVAALALRFVKRKEEQ